MTRFAKTRAVAAAAALAAACGGATVAPAPAAAPSTAADPPPYSPPSQSRGAPGAPTGLAVASGYEQARHVALELVEAIRVGDAHTLGRLLDARVARALPFFVPVDRTREQVIASVVAEARRRGVDPASSIGDLVAIDGIEVAALSTHLDGAAPPAGLRATDLVVELPMAEAGRRLLRRILPGWLERGRVVVRLGATPVVVGL